MKTQTSPSNKISTEFFESSATPYIEDIREEYRLHLGIYDLLTLATIEEAFKTFDSSMYTCTRTLRAALSRKGYLLGNGRDSSIVFINTFGEGEVLILPDEDDADGRPCVSQQTVAEELVNLLKAYVQLFPINYDRIFNSNKVNRIKAAIKHLQNRQLTLEEEEFIGQPLDPFAQTTFKEFMFRFLSITGHIHPNERMTKKIVDFLIKTRK